METSAILGRIKSVHKSHSSIMELFMRELKQIAIVCAAIVAAVSAWAAYPRCFNEYQTNYVANVIYELLNYPEMNLSD